MNIRFHFLLLAFCAVLAPCAQAQRVLTLDKDGYPQTPGFRLDLGGTYIVGSAHVQGLAIDVNADLNSQTGGYINTSSGGGINTVGGGSIITAGGGAINTSNSGGAINTSNSGGAISTKQGGSIDTSNGGGAISTVGGGPISTSQGVALKLGGNGSPQGVFSAPVGSIYTRADGGAGSTLYVKESGGTGNTGWVAK